MRKLILFFAASLFLSGTMFAQDANVAPDWELVSAAGETVRLSEELRRQPVVLLFWATWCPYCKALMPHLQSLRLEHGDELEILAINFSDPDGDPVSFIHDAGYDFTILPGGDAVAEAYRIYGTPGVIVVDQDRIVRFDLRSLPLRDFPESNKSSSHKRKAAYLAPYWAAEIRKSVDQVLGAKPR
jgi:thiol-disulfide isomerase/thioredoxin